MLASLASSKGTTHAQDLSPPKNRVALVEVNVNNVGLLRRLNATLFPVEYKDGFYRDVVQSGELARYVYLNDVCVGAVCCKRAPLPPSLGSGEGLYLMTLGILQSYRRLGLGSLLLDYILTQVCPKNPSLNQVFLHVQEGNQEALDFYRSHGFTDVGMEKDYYVQVTPSDAHILTKTVSP
ncbi:acyl-CoA N-acyltransferase [Piptocephalis cylindrospora]|uniref:N-terminal methionine N(alpha)-acetyltransferase NatE n=1 Tax=Piptocephalis cylindrospora TaxID=1907219 RepID=A0A4P9Y8N6_9FUNG|nr:acyl-CoA N-acyltransferase [Piptocephalis cylindrospora]|eukprot:RKP15473.1 acyl-CoA N-acyltransferase [Piptocephalis cylindrospora]